MTTADPDGPAATVATAIVDDAEAMERFVDSAPTADTGAVVVFRGIVRNHDDGREVRQLEYEGHPSAGEVLRQAAAEVARTHPEVSCIRMAHRVGLLSIGDCALFAEVWAPHRAAAFAACADVVDDIKRVLPVWKRQVFASGADEWVNSP